MLRVIDTETTSFEGGIVEIASVDIVKGVICNPMSDLVRPAEPIGFAAMAIHHITEDMVSDAPLISDVIGKYLGADAYVAHNAAFDKGKLPQITSLDLHVKAGAQAVSEFESHGNQYLRYRLGLKPEVPEGLYAHRALYDCYVTAELLMYMGREAQWSIGKCGNL
jgi:exodeoxyribonuclease X